MTYQLFSDNEAYKLRLGQKDLIAPASSNLSEDFKRDTLLSTHRCDFKPPPPSEIHTEMGKKRQLMEKYLFEKISEDIALKEFRPRTPPNYISTTRAHFDVPGFDPDASLRPNFDYSLYIDPAITYWSENKRQVHGVTIPENQTRNFHCSKEFSKPVEEKWDNSLATRYDL